jgi:hypothetical protein
MGQTTAMVKADTKVGLCNVEMMVEVDNFVLSGGC